MGNRKLDKILIKKSGVVGKIPTALELGELAINFADVKLYASGTTANSITPIGWDRIARTGDTVTGNFNFNGVVSATTYLNLPLDIRVTGGTYNAGTATFTNNTGGTFNVSGFSTGGTNTYVTGGTYSSASTTTTFTNNTGGTFGVTGYSNMYKSVYDTDGDGIIDMSKSVATFVDLQEAVSAGDPVYVSTTNIPNMMVKRARQDTPSTLPALGVMLESGTGGQTKKAVLYGKVIGLNTTGIPVNTIVYVGPTGGFTQTKPSTNAQPIGVVIRTGGSDGVLAVAPQIVIATDIYVTGGTYSSGTATFRNNSGSTFSVSGFSTGGSSSVAAFTGTTTLDFGFTGGSEGDFASTIITNTNVTPNSSFVYRIISSTDHSSVEDSLLDGLNLQESDIVNGVGFTLNGYALNNTWGTYNIFYKIIN